MKPEKIEYAVLKNAVRTISVLCAADENTLIDLLTGYVWDEEEAGSIKESSGKHELNDQ